MEIGLVTYAPEIVRGYNYHVYYSKWVNGSIFPAAKDMQNDVTCFCDAKAIREKADIVAISKNGPALRKNRKVNLAFDYVCPTNPEYRNKVLEYIKELNKEDILGTTLNLYHFPEEEFCVCPRCVELWRISGLNWIDWRADTVTKFIAEAKKYVRGTFAVEMFPDPVLAKQRFGIDFDRIAELVDYFHVPLSARDYTTNYWVDLMARDFLRILKKPVVLELSAEMPNFEKMDSLLKTIAHLSKHSFKAILLLVHDSKNAMQISEFAVKNNDFRDWLAKFEFSEMIKIVEKWATIY
jgi:hypothetical protein